jgi:hypothetical protein
LTKIGTDLIKEEIFILFNLQIFVQIKTFEMKIFCSTMFCFSFELLGEKNYEMSSVLFRNIFFALLMQTITHLAKYKHQKKKKRRKKKEKTEK